MLYSGKPANARGRETVKMCQCLTLVDNVCCVLNSLLADKGAAMNKLLLVTVLAALLALSKWRNYKKTSKESLPCCVRRWLTFDPAHTIRRRRLPHAPTGGGGGGGGGAGDHEQNQVLHQVHV